MVQAHLYTPIYKLFSEMYCASSKLLGVIHLQKHQQEAIKKQWELVEDTLNVRLS